MNSMSTIEESIQQLHDTTTQHQTAIDSIQATLVVQQNDIAAIKTSIIDIRTSINHMIHSVSEIATKLGFEITLPSSLPLSPTPPTPPSIAGAVAPTSFPDAAATSTITSSSSDRTRPDVVPPALTSILTPVVGSGKTTATTGTYTSTLPPNLERHFSSVEGKSATNRLDEALHLAVGGFRKVYNGDIDGGSTKFAIKGGSPTSDQIHPDKYYFGVMLFGVLYVRPALNPSLPKEQQWANKLTEHKLFDLMLKSNRQKIYEIALFVFDPGGTKVLSFYPGVAYRPFDIFRGDETKTRTHVIVKGLLEDGTATGFQANIDDIFLLDGACLVAQGGSLMNLAIHPGSAVQVLGKIELMRSFVVWLMQDDAQLNHNSSSSASAPRPPTHDLEDKVDF